MPVAVPQYLQTRHILNAKIQGANLSATNELTFGTAVDLVIGSGLGTFKGFEFNDEWNNVNLRASDSGVANYQTEYEDWSATIREIIPANGIGVINTLLNVPYEYFRLDIAYKTAAMTAGTRLILIGIRNSAPFPIGEGENVTSLSLKPCGISIWMGNLVTTPPY